MSNYYEQDEVLSEIFAEDYPTIGEQLERLGEAVAAETTGFSEAEMQDYYQNLNESIWSTIGSIGSRVASGIGSLLGGGGGSTATGTNTGTNTANTSVNPNITVNIPASINQSPTQTAVQRPQVSNYGSQRQHQSQRPQIANQFNPQFNPQMMNAQMNPYMAGGWGGYPAPAWAQPQVPVAPAPAPAPCNCSNTAAPSANTTQAVLNAILQNPQLMANLTGGRMTNNINFGESDNETAESAENDAEFFQALIPLVSSVLPSVIQGVGGLINRGRRPRQQQVQQQAPVQQFQPQPQPQRAPSAVPAQLMGLLQNPQIANTLTQLLGAIRR
jgi:hypothetical protein